MCIRDSIITIAFGEDLSEDMIQLMVRTDEKPWEMQHGELTFTEALYEMGKQMGLMWSSKMQLPLNWFWSITGRVLTFSAYQRTVERNCQIVRDHVMAYVQARKSGLRKSQVADGADILSVFFANPEVFTDEFIVDELLDFFIAAAVTTKNAMQSIVAHLIK